MARVTVGHMLASVLLVVATQGALAPPLAAQVGASPSAQQSKHITIGSRTAWVSRSGRDTVLYRNEKDARVLVYVEDMVRLAGTVDTVVALALRHLHMPPDLLISARVCGEGNAFYIPQRREVALCLELFWDIMQVMKPAEGSTESSFNALLGSGRFFAAHEIGHALIHRYRLPVVGEEEVAADQFALWLLRRDDDETSLLSTALLFLELGMNEEWTATRVESAHGLSLARSWRVRCWATAGPGVSPLFDAADERQRCLDDVAAGDRAWQQLLAPYLKPRPRKKG